MLDRGKKKAKLNKGNVKKEAKDVVFRDAAAIKIQCLMRRFVARARIRRLTKEVWTRVFDPTYKRYFWFDKLHQVSDWKQPKHAVLFDERDFMSVVNMQKLVRGFIHRMRARKFANEAYRRYFDLDTNRFYWLDQRTQMTTYNASKWLIKQNITMPIEDQLLLQSQLKIKELERKLQEKELEIKEIRQARYEELEPAVLKDKAKAAKNLQRSKQMDGMCP
jgi:hypothetical protein